MRVVLTTGTLMIGRVSRTTLAFRSCAAALNVSRLHSTRAVPRATVIILMLRPPFPAQTAPALPRIKWPCAAIDTTYSEVTSTRGSGGAFFTYAPCSKGSGSLGYGQPVRYLLDALVTGRRLDCSARSARDPPASVCDASAMEKLESIPNWDRCNPANHDGGADHVGGALLAFRRHWKAPLLLFPSLRGRARHSPPNL